jgi:hypothetical protein
MQLDTRERGFSKRCPLDMRFDPKNLRVLLTWGTTWRKAIWPTSTNMERKMLRQARAIAQASRWRQPPAGGVVARESRPTGMHLQPHLPGAAHRRERGVAGGGGCASGVGRLTSGRRLADPFIRWKTGLEGSSAGKAGLHHPPGSPCAPVVIAKLVEVVRRPVSTGGVAENPRSRSAKLRVAEKI